MASILITQVVVAGALSACLVGVVYTLALLDANVPALATPRVRLARGIGDVFPFGAAAELTRFDHSGEQLFLLLKNCDNSSLIDAAARLAKADRAIDVVIFTDKERAGAQKRTGLSVVTSPELFAALEVLTTPCAIKVRDGRIVESAIVNWVDQLDIIAEA